ncbi:MAG: hypothetical protein ACC657_05200 [Thiohalomonadales bacterium]
MNIFKKFLILILLTTITACGGSGDTKVLKQIVEQNKLGITSIVLKSKLTQTLIPDNAGSTTPTFYFYHGDSEQITVTGFNEEGNEIALSNISFSIIDESSTAGASTINDNGQLLLETFNDATTIKNITVQAKFGSVTGTALVKISSFPITTGGMSLWINNSQVDGTTKTVTVCDSTALEARAIFNDPTPSTRIITSKINWPGSIDANDISNVKFDITDLNNPLFSSHTNSLNATTPYKLTVNYLGYTPAPTVDFIVEQGSFSNMVVSPTSKTLEVGDTQLLSLTANINNKQQTNLETTAKWTTADVNIVDVNPDTGLVTAKAIGGPIIITAGCGTATQTSNITVEVLTLEYIKIHDFDKTVVKNGTIEIKLPTGTTKTTQLTLFAHKKSSTNTEVVSEITSEISSITWSVEPKSSVAGNITIDDKGLVTIKGAGDVKVNVEYKGNKNTDTVNIIVTVQ